MKVIAPGHTYALKVLDDDRGHEVVQPLWFVKRVGEGYPGNTGRPHSGTTTQEVLRALIERTQYVDGQIPHLRNAAVLSCLRQAIYELEARAAERHGRLLEFGPLVAGALREGKWIEELPTCDKCNHIGCDGSCHDGP